MRPFCSNPVLRTISLKQSGIRAASTRCANIKGINLGQGICDLPIPDLIKQHAYRSEIMVTHGSTGAFVCASYTLFNPRDEGILFEPFYGYHKNVLE